MGPVGLLAASEIRRRWRSTIAIALLAGIVGAVVFATAAGARRSGSALRRFNAASRSSDLEIDIGVRSPKELVEFARTPGIQAIAHMRAYAFSIEGLDDDVPIAAPLDDAMGKVVDRSRLIAGHRADPSNPSEIVIGEGFAARLHLGIGSRLKVGSFTQDQITRLFGGGDPEPPTGPEVEFHVVGIVRLPLDLGVRSATGGVVVLTPAFSRTYQGRMGAFTDVIRVRTTGGKAVQTKVSDTARRRFGDDQTFGITALGVETEGAKSAIDVLTLALWTIVGVTALAGLVAVSIVLTRDIGHTDLDPATLRGLGLTRAQRTGLNAPRILVMAGIGALVAALGALALSPLLPIGLARRADPDPGLHADWTVLVIAVLATAVVVAAVGFLAAARTTRHTSFERAPHAYRRTSTIVERAAHAGLRPTATSGLRMAIQSGRGENAIPTRSAFAGAVLGVAGVTAALVFAGSLSHLVATPHLYGWTFAAKVDVDASPPCGDRHDYGVSKQPGVAAVAVVCETNSAVSVDGHDVTGLGFSSLHGSIDPETVSGRAPRDAHEVALGSVTLDHVRKDIGDSVQVRGPSGKVRKYTIVGRVVLPAIAEVPLADGATFTGPGLLPLYDAGENESQFLVARAEPGAEAAVRQALSDLPSRDVPHARNLVSPTAPVELLRVEQIDRVPAAIGALLGALALIAVGYAAVTAVRRRRHELAVLKILGFTRGQVRATVAWQTSTVGLIGLVLGIPIGVIVGRLIWHLVANGLGVSTVVAIPWLTLIVLVPGALVLVNLIAYVPGRSVARAVPAVVLRTE